MKKSKAAKKAEKKAQIGSFFKFVLFMVIVIAITIGTKALLGFIAKKLFAESKKVPIIPKVKSFKLVKGPVGKKSFTAKLKAKTWDDKL